MGSFRKLPLAHLIEQSVRKPAPDWRAILGLALGGAGVVSAQAATNIDIVSIGNTNLVIQDGIHNVNNTAAGNVAVNVFNKFYIDTPDTVNLNFQANKLVNIVRDKVEVHGVLNSYKSGQLGGDVVFATSHGFLVGPQGIVNVGKLTIDSPDASTLSAWESLSGNDLNQALADRSYAVSEAGTVRIQGLINTANGIDIRANNITVSEGAVLVAGDVTGAADRVASFYYQMRPAVNAVDVGAANALRADAEGNIILAAEAEGDANLWNPLPGGGKAEVSVYVEIHGELYAQDIEATALAKAEAAYEFNTNYQALDQDFDPSQYDEEIAISGVWASTSLWDSGIPLNNIEAHADARVVVNSTAKLVAEGDITLHAETYTSVSTDGLGEQTVPSLEQPGESTTIFLAAPLVYGKVAGNSEVVINASATVNAEGDLTLLAHNEASLGLQAMTAPPPETTGVGDPFAIAVAASDINSKAIIETGAVVKAADVSVIAENISSFDVSATGDAALAIGIFNTEAVAHLGANLGSNGNRVDDVSVLAINRIDKQQVSTNATSPEADNPYTISTISVGFASQAPDVAGQITDLVDRLIGADTEVDAAGDMARGTSENGTAENGTPTDANSKLTWETGVAITVNTGNHKSEAFIGNTAIGGAAPQIYSDGQVAVLAQTDTRLFRTLSEAEAKPEAAEANQDGTQPTQQGNSVSVAVATSVAVQDSVAVAEIGDGVYINADTVGVIAQQSNTFNNPWTEWDNMLTVLEGLVGVADDIADAVTSFANATASTQQQGVQQGQNAGGKAFGGAFNVQVVNHDTKAWVGDGAHIIANGSDDPACEFTYDLKVRHLDDDSLTDDFDGDNAAFGMQWWMGSAVKVAAYNKINALHLNGNMGAKLVKPTKTNGTAIGGTVAYVDWRSDAVAGIGEARIEATNGTLDIEAINNDMQVLVTPSAGMGKGVGFSGALAILNVNNYTSASLNNKAWVEADTVLIGASQLLSHWAASGAFSMTDKTAIGIGAAIVISNADTEAYIGDNSEDAALFVAENVADQHPVPTPVPAPGVLMTTPAIITRELQVTSANSGMTGAIGVAGSVAKSSSSQQGGAAAGQGGTSAGNGAGNQPSLWEKFKGFIADPEASLLSAFDGATKDEPSDGSVTQNDGSSSNNNSVTSIGSATRDAKAPPAGGSSGGSTPPAGQSTDSAQSAGLAASGAFTVMVADLNANAYINGANIESRDSDETADVSVEALNKTVQVSAAGGAALVMNSQPSSSSSTALAGAIAYQISNNNTNALINNSTITRAGNVAVDALSSGERISIGIGAGVNTTPSSSSGNSISAALSVSAAQVLDETSAAIKGGTITALAAEDTALNVTAYNSTDIGVGGGAVYAGGKTGLGLSITFATIGNQAGKDAISAAISGARINHFDSIGVDAFNASRIVLASAGVGIQSASGGPAVSLGGSFGVGDISTRTRALINDGAVITGGDVSVNAVGTKNQTLDDRLNDRVDSALNGSINASQAAKDAIDAAEAAADAAEAANVAEAAAVAAKKLWDANLQDLAKKLDYENKAAIAEQLAADAEEAETLADTKAAESASYDFSGRAAYGKTGTHTSEDGGERATYSAEGERIIVAVGQVNVAMGASGAAAGIAYGHADIHTVREARIDNATIKNAGDVEVNARNESLIYNVVVGVAVSSGNFSGVGSVGVSRINNKVIAEIGQWDQNNYVTDIVADSLSLDADNRAQIIAATGGVAITAGAGAAGGLAVSVNLVGDRGGENGQITRARVGNATLDVEDLSVHAQSGDDSERNQIIGNAIGVGVSTQGAAFSGAITVNNIDQTVHAGVKNIDGEGVNGVGNVDITAQDNTYSVGTAWSIAGAGGGPAVGVAVVVNRADDHVTAELLGGGTAEFNVNDANITAQRNLEMLTIDAGVAVSQSVAVAPSVGTSYTSGTVLARIADNATLYAQNNVKVAAESDTLSHAASGAVGVGIQGGAGALAVSTVIDDSNTFAYIADSEVTALGKGSKTSINSGVLIGQADLANLENSDQEAADRRSLESNFKHQKIKEDSDDINGLAVNATSYNRMLAVEIAGSGGLGVGVAVNAATHAFNGETKAYIDNSDINKNIDVATESGADVLVRSGSHNAALGITAGIAIAGGGGAVAGLVLNLEDHNNIASITNSDIRANHLTLEAATTNTLQGVAVGVGAGGFGGAASVVTNKFDGDTLAWLSDGTINANHINVVAKNAQETNAATGSVGVGAGAGIGMGLIVNLVSGNTRSIVGDNPFAGSNVNNLNTKLHASNVNVQAVRAQNIQGYAFGAGLSSGGAGIAGMINVSDTTGETRAGIYDTEMSGAQGSSAANVQLAATEYFTAKHVAAALGAGAVGVGAAFNVILNSTQTIAELVNSNTRADALTLKALSENDGQSTSVAGGAGAFGGAISLGYIRQGSGSGSLGTQNEDGNDQGGAQDFNASQGAINGILADSGNALDNNHSLSASERAKLKASSQAQLDVEAGETSQTLNAVEGQALTNGTGKIIAARISGGEVNATDITVDSIGETQNRVLSGGVAAGMVAASGGLGIIRNYNQNLALVDGVIHAENITVNALERNGDGHAAEVESFSGSAGGIAISVAVSDARVENTVKAKVTQAEGNNNGNLSVTAADTSSAKVGGDENIPTNITVALAAVSLSHATAKKDSNVTVELGRTGKNIKGFEVIDANAVVSGMVRSTAFTASAAYFGNLVGVFTYATDDSSANVLIAGNYGAGLLNASSNVLSETSTRSYGIAVSAGVSVGASIAESKVNTSSSVTVANGTDFSDSLLVNLAARTGQNGTAHNTDAQAFAASGGLLAGAAGAASLTQNTSSTHLIIGDNVKVSGISFTAQANANTSNYSDADGFFAGALAVGSINADANSNVVTKVSIGKNLQNKAGNRMVELSLASVSNTKDVSRANAAGGGAISGSAATAETDTRGSSELELKAWDAAATSLDAYVINLLASHTAFFAAGADSINASALGLSGAITDSYIDVKSRINVADNVELSAGQILLNALTDVKSRDEGSNNVAANAGAGGFLNGTAAEAITNVKQQAEIILGEKVKFALTRITNFTDYLLRLDAKSVSTIFSEARMTSGGAFQGGGSKSIVNIDTTNTVKLGEDSKLSSEQGDIELGTHGIGLGWASANVNVYGAAGLAVGHAASNVNTNNNLELGDRVVIDANGSINLYAGRSASHLSDNNLTARSTSDVYNGTAIPLDTDPVVRAISSVNNNIVIGSGVKVTSVRNIWLQAVEGVMHAVGEGRGRDLYDGIFSSERKVSHSQLNSNSLIKFNGESYFEAGIRYEQVITVNADGTWTLGDNTVADVSLVDDYSSRAALQQEIDALESEKDELLAELQAITIPDQQVVLTYDDDIYAEEDVYAADVYNEDGTTIVHYAGDPKENTTPIHQKGDPVLDEDDNEIVQIIPGYTPPTPARLGEITALLNDLNEIVSRLSTGTNDAVRIANVTAAAGDINLTAKNIQASGGNVQLIANGGPKIDIVNNSNNSLILEDLFILNSDGGRIKVTGAVAGNIDNIANLMRTENGVGNTALINVDHNATDNKADVMVSGNIQNLGGMVSMDLAWGNMLQTGSIAARQTSILVSNGIYVLRSDAYQSYGFSPTSLKGYQQSAGWMGESATDIVNLWVNAKYQSKIAELGIEGFNKWLYSADYKTFASGSNADLYLFTNWGFQYDCTTNCVSLSFPNGAGGDARGGSSWNFSKIPDVRSELKNTATYAQIKAEGYGAGSGAALSSEAIFINAAEVDINGTIRAGSANNWSVRVNAGFDAAMEQYVESLGLNAGDKVSLKAGQSLTLANGTSINLGISIIDPDTNDAVSYSGINLTYDVATKQILLDDVTANGNGYVSITGKILSTGPDGKILVDDGYGNVIVDNKSNAELVINRLDVGGTSTGVVRIEDKNFTNQVDWYVHAPGESIQHYRTAVGNTYEGLTGTTVGTLNPNGTASVDFMTKAGQLYTWTQTTSVSRTIANWQVSPYWGQWGNFTEWKFTNQNNHWTEPSRTGVVSCGVATVACNSTDYLTQKLTATWGSSQVDGRYFSYEKYYGADAVRPKINAWYVHAYTDLGLTSTSYVKADHAIKIEFVGSGSGGITVDSVAGINLQGDINNPNGTTKITSSNGDIKAGSGAVINSKTTELTAKGSIASDAQALRLITSNVMAKAGGLVNLDLTAQDTSAINANFSAGSGLTVNSNVSLQASGAGTHIKAKQVNINSGGAIGSSDAVFTIDVEGNINLSAAGDIYINQPNGDLYVGSIESESGNIGITVGNGSLRNAIGMQSYSEEEKAYLSSLWDQLGLTDANAGSQAVVAFENNVNNNLLQLWQVRERLQNTDLSDEQRSELQAKEAELTSFFNGLTVEDESGKVYLNKDLSDAQSFESVAYTNYSDYWATKNQINKIDMEFNQNQRRINHLNGLLTSLQAEIADERAKALEDGLPFENAMETDLIGRIAVLNDAQNELNNERGALNNGLQSIQAWFAEQVDNDVLASDPTSSYRLDWLLFKADGALQEQLIAGAQWSNNALEIVISHSALTPTTTGFISDRDANISGANVTLNIANGSLGSDLPNKVLAIDKATPVLTDDEKAALYGAGAGDVTLADAGDVLNITVRQQNPLKINATGNVDITVKDHVYAESDLAMALSKINAGGDVRLATAREITSASGNATTISADNLNLATQSNGIGSVQNPLNLHLAGILRNVSTQGDVFINSTNGNFRLGSIGSSGVLNIRANGDILNATGTNDVYHMRAKGAVLVAEDANGVYNLGSGANALRLTLSDGDLLIKGDDAWLAIDQGGEWFVDSIDLAGDLSLSSNGAINGKEIANLEQQLADPVSLANIKAHLNVAGETTLSANTGIGNPLVVKTPWLTINSTSGDINVVALSDINALRLDANNGDAFVWVNGALIADNLHFTDGVFASTAGMHIKASEFANAEFLAGDWLTVDQMSASTVTLEAEADTHIGDIEANIATITSKGNVDINQAVIGDLILDAVGNANIADITSEVATITVEGNVDIGKAVIDDALITSGGTLDLADGTFNTSAIIASEGAMHIVKSHFGSALLTTNDTLRVEYARLNNATMTATNGMQLDQIDMLATGPLILQGKTVMANIDGGYGLRSRDNFAGHATTPLQLSVSGMGATQTDHAVINVTNMPKLTIDQLLAKEGSLTAPEQVTLLRGESTNRFSFLIDRFEIDLDNQNRAAKPVDAQMITPYGNYWFNVSNGNLSTDAQITRFNPRSLNVIYVGRDGEIVEGSAYMGLSVESRQANVSQVANAGPRMRRPTWFNRVLSFTRVGSGVDEEGNESEAINPNALREEHAYSVTIEL